MENKSENMERSLRLKILRQMADLTINELSQRYGFSIGTLKAWEAASRSPITEKGAFRVIEAFKKEGIDCTAEWLLYGTGYQPRYANVKPARDIQSIGYGDESAIVKQQMDEYLNAYPNAITLEIKDDAMHPVFSKGDFVGGIWLNKTELQKCLYKFCIISVPGQGFICRQINKITDNKFNCVALNINSDVNNLVLQNLKLDKAAIINMHWLPIFNNC